MSYGGQNVMMKRGLCAAVVTLVAGLGAGPAVASASAAPANVTWTGQAGTGLWSTAGNWQGGVAPSATMGSLSFPASACTPATRCESETDIENVSVGALNLDDATGYVIHPLSASDSAEALSIGSGGLSATTQATSAPGGTPVLGPVTFTGAQTWTVSGGPAGVGGLTVGQVTGSSSGVGTAHASAPSLALDLADQGLLTLAGNGVDNELGALTVTGADASDTGSAASQNGTVAFTSSGGELNSVNRTQVTLDDVALMGAGTVGPLRATGSLIGLGSGESVGITHVNGNASLGGGTLLDLPLLASGSVTPAGTDYAQLSATGRVTLNGVSLELVPSSPRCPSLVPGDVDSVVTATGGISGTFTGMPNGTQVTLDCVGQEPTIEINYTLSAVTATVESAGGPAYPTVVQLNGPASPPTVGQSMQISANVAPRTAAVSESAGVEPAGTLTFFADGQAISSCGAETLSASDSGVGAACSFNAPSGVHTFTATYTPSSTEWATATSNSVSINPTPATSASPATPHSPASPFIAVTASPTTTSVTSASPTASLAPVMKLRAGRDPADPELLSDTATLTTSAKRTATQTVSGQVGFFDGSLPIPGCGAIALSAGHASCTTGFQTLGAQTITAVYTPASAAFSPTTAHAMAWSALAAPTATFSHFNMRTPALSLTVRSPQAALTGVDVSFLTPGISFDAFAALMTSNGTLSVAHGGLGLGLAHPASAAYFQLGTGALKLTGRLPAHGAILTLVTLNFAHRPSAELILSIPRR